MTSTEYSGIMEKAVNPVTLISLGILLLWEKVLTKKHNIFKIIPVPPVAVAIGIIYFVSTQGSSFSIPTSRLVSVPVPEDAASFFGQFTLPMFSEITNSQVWVVAITIAIVASIDTLLSVEAIDKIDPRKRVTSTNRELFAQETGNIVSELIGGLSITHVIVRSSANTQSGGQTKLSTIMHGLLILVSIIAVLTLLNLIPLAVLAAVLLLVGFKLVRPQLFVQMYKASWKQSTPFIVTVLGIVLGDLLVGIGLGLLVGICVILIKSYQNSYFLHKENIGNGSKTVKMTLAEEVTFINKGAIIKELNQLEENSYLIMDVSKTHYLDNDIIEILDDFKIKAEERNINIKIISERGEVENPKSYQQFFLNPKTA